MWKAKKAKGNLLHISYVNITIRIEGKNLVMKREETTSNY